MQDQLDGMVAIVTGGGSLASGIGNGRAAAVLLAEAGARVLIVDMVAERMEETRDLIRSRGADCIAVTADVSRPEDCARVVDTAVSQWGRLDILVNNVGTAGPPGTVVDVDIDAWNACISTNVTSMMLMSRFAIPHMVRSGGGSIVNVTSVCGITAIHPAIAYSTTKGAILNFTRSMAASHGPDGIRVNAVAPGFVHTPIVYAQGLDEEGREQRRLMSPLRTEGTGWDVGEAILFLASARAKWITGVTIPVDAGLTATIPIAPTMTVSTPSAVSRS
jgi:NAD(P)-dependent dehydrogenase (short-subunit alcohol dehydrogenase family)